MSFFTYILECSDGKYYTGFTDDPDARVIAHNTGEYPNTYTLRRRPLNSFFMWNLKIPRVPKNSKVIKKNGRESKNKL